jgi:hypothetical protein
MNASRSRKMEGAARPPRPSFARRLLGWLWGKDRAVLGIGAGVSGALAVVGVAHIAWPWLWAAGCAVTAVAALATRAVETHKLKDKVHNLWAALAVSCAISTIAFCYHEWWDPSRARPSSYQVVVNGSGSAQMLYPYDQPGGTQGYNYAPIPAGITVTLSCYVSLQGSGLWFRVAGNHGWIPRDTVHAIPGIPFPNPPLCS